MKIALTIESFAPRKGGAGQYASWLAYWLLGLGHRVEVFAREVQSEAVPPGVTAHQLELPWWGRGPWRPYAFAVAVQQTLEQRPFDLILGLGKSWYQHVSFPQAGGHRANLIGISRTYRSAWARRMWWGMKSLELRQWVFRHIEHRQFAEHQPHVIAASRRMAADFRELYAIPQRRLHVIPNTLGPQPPSPTAAACWEFREQLGATPDDVLILFAAHNPVLKGLEPLLEAFAPVARQAPHARLVVCGAPASYAARRRAAQLGIARQTHFLGRIPQLQVAYASCDLFAFPSCYDTSSLVVLEAIHHGLPVITTRCNGAHEVLDHGRHGYVIDSPWSLEALQVSLRNLVTNARLRQEMSGAARERGRELANVDYSGLLDQVLRQAAADPQCDPRRLSRLPAPTRDEVFHRFDPAPDPAVEIEVGGLR